MNSQLLSIKAKKFGVRLAAFRQKKGLTTEVLSQWTGISNEKLKSIEQGETTITLPEIELIALKLGYSIETLIAGNLQEIITSNPDESSVLHYSGLRDRIIALILRKTRTEQNQTLEDVAAKCNLETEELNQYESGGKPVPLPILECLCGEYQIPLLSLVAQKPSSDPSPVSELSSPEVNDTLPEELSEFVNNPANLPYLELARKLSELDAAKLRSIAEGLLEITY
jgi:transcriptional regulator with XRE-family HTH domain